MPCDARGERGCTPWLAAALLLVVGAGCDTVDCTRQSDCAAGLYCNESLSCVPIPPDAGSADGGADLLPDLLPPPDLTNRDALDLTVVHDLWGVGDLSVAKDLSLEDLATSD